MRLKKILFATKNNGKLREVKKILGDEYEVVSLLDYENVPDVVEDKETFIDNAIKKAKEIFDLFNVPVIADDSGLSVEQLNGAPGVYSARYAGINATDEENNKKLLSALKDFSQPHKAKFICTAVYYDGKEYLSAEGEVKGEIIKVPRGNNGFGYDPLFLPDGFEFTTAELSLEEKNKISHRTKAFKELASKIRTKNGFDLH